MKRDRIRHLATVPVLVFGLAQLGVHGCHGRRDPTESSRVADQTSAPGPRAGVTVSSTPLTGTAMSPAEVLSPLVPVVHPMRFEPSPVPSLTSTSIRLRGPRAFDVAKQAGVLLEIENDGPRPAIPDVVFKFADAGGNPVGSGRCMVMTVVVLPGERVPCTLGAPAAATSAIYEISTASDFSAARAAKNIRLQLAVKQAKLGSFPEGAASSLALPVVTGVVVNPTREPATGNVQVVFYDEQGGIAGVTESQVEGGPIRPGARAPFRAVSNHFLAAKSFSVTAYAISTRFEWPSDHGLR